MRRRRWLGALAALAAAGLLLGASFAVWLRLPDGSGGTTTVAGWGAVTGGQISGQNLNDAMDGQATFRPGWLPLAAGVLALLAAILLATVVRGRRPHRVAGGILVGSGLLGLVWGVWRAVVPDSVGLLETGEGSPGAGQWLTLAGGLIALLAGAAVLLGVPDPPARPVRPGIQP